MNVISFIFSYFLSECVCVLGGCKQYYIYCNFPIKFLLNEKKKQIWHFRVLEDKRKAWSISFTRDP